jgi:hypothetical protein
MRCIGTDESLVADDDPTDLHVAHFLAAAVPGVASVQVTGGAER